MTGKQLTWEEQQRMANDLEADSLSYLPLDAIARCINLSEERLCRACLTGDYPTATGERLYQLSLRRKDSNGRTYEKNGCDPKQIVYEPGKVR
jgi:amidophosphoribosyltransferase